MGIGRAGVNDRIAGIGGACTCVELVPAVRQIRDRRRGGRISVSRVKVLLERQRGDHFAQGVGGDDVGVSAEVRARAAVRLDIDVIGGGVVQIGQGEGKARDRLCGASAQGEACRAVFNHPRGGGAVLRPG